MAHIVKISADQYRWYFRKQDLQLLESGEVIKYFNIDHVPAEAVFDSAFTTIAINGGSAQNLTDIEEYVHFTITRNDDTQITYITPAIQHDTNGHFESGQIPVLIRARYRNVMETVVEMTMTDGVAMGAYEQAWGAGQYQVVLADEGSLHISNMPVFHLGSTGQPVPAPSLSFETYMEDATHSRGGEIARDMHGNLRYRRTKESDWEHIETTNVPNRFVFPSEPSSTPVENESYFSDGVLYIYNGEEWKSVVL